MRLSKETKGHFIAEKYQIGQIIKFGAYLQNADARDNTSIEWQVLDIEKDKMLIISKYGLENRFFHSNFKQIIWEFSDIRKWLNDTFLNNCFKDDENVVPNCSWWLRTHGCNNYYVSNILNDGSINYYGSFVYWDIHHVRPVMWIKINEE